MRKAWFLLIYALLGTSLAHAYYYQSVSSKILSGGGGGGGSGGQTQNTYCYPIYANGASSGTIVAWAGNGCTTAYAMPVPPALANSPVTIQPGTVLGFTIAGNGTIGSSTNGTNDGPSFNSIIANHDVEIMSPGAGKAYSFLTMGGQNSPDVQLPSNRNIRCCTDSPNFNCSSNNPTDYNPRTAGWAIAGDLSSQYTGYTMFQSGAGVPLATNVTVFGCRFIGYFHDLTAPVVSSGTLANQIPFQLFNGSSNFQFINNVFDGLGGQVGPIDNIGTGTANNNNQVVWNLIEAGGTNATYYSGINTNFIEEHNTEIDVNSDLEFFPYTYAAQNNGLIGYNLYGLKFGSAYCNSQGFNPQTCNTGFNADLGFVPCHTTGPSGSAPVPCSSTAGPNASSIVFEYNRLIGNWPGGASYPQMEINESNYQAVNNWCGAGSGDSLVIPAIFFDNTCLAADHCNSTILCPTGSCYSSSCAAGTTTACGTQPIAGGSQTCSNQ